MVLLSLVVLLGLTTPCDAQLKLHEEWSTDSLASSPHVSFPIPVAYLQPMHARGGNALFAYELPDGTKGIAEITPDGTPRCSVTPWKFPGNVTYSYARNTREWFGADSTRGYRRYKTFDTIGVPLPVIVGRTTICPANDGASYFIVSAYGQVRHVDTSGRILSTTARTLARGPHDTGRHIHAQHIGGDTIALLLNVGADSMCLYFISADGLDSTRTITLPAFKEVISDIAYIYDPRTRCHAVIRGYSILPDTSLYIVREHQPCLVLSTNGYTDLSFHPTEDVIAAMDNGKGMVLIDTRTGTVREFKGNQPMPLTDITVRWAANGESLLVIQHNGIVRYNLEFGTIDALVPWDRLDYESVSVCLMNDGRHYCRIVEQGTERRYYITDAYTSVVVDSTSYVQLTSGVQLMSWFSTKGHASFVNGMFLSSRDFASTTISMHMQELVWPHRYQRYFDLPDPAGRTVSLNVSSRHGNTLSVVDHQLTPPPVSLAVSASYVLDASTCHMLTAVPGAEITDAPLHLDLASERPGYEARIFPLANALNQADMYGNTTQCTYLPFQPQSFVPMPRPIIEASHRVLRVAVGSHTVVTDILTGDRVGTLRPWTLYTSCCISPDERYVVINDAFERILYLYDLSDVSIRGTFAFPDGIQRIEWPDDSSTILVWHGEGILSAYSIRGTPTSISSTPLTPEHPWTATHHDGILSIRSTTPVNDVMHVRVYTLGGDLLASGGFAAEGALPLVCAPQPLLLVVRIGECITTGIIMDNMQ